MVAGKRIVGGFFLLMMGFGFILDTSWPAVGVGTAVAGVAFLLWGVMARS